MSNKLDCGPMCTCSMHAAAVAAFHTGISWKFFERFTLEEKYWNRKILEYLSRKLTMLSDSGESVPTTLFTTYLFLPDPAKSTIDGTVLFECLGIFFTEIF